MSQIMSPVRYDPALDAPGADEVETTRAITDTMLKIAQKTLSDGQHAIRSVHAKSHGLLEAQVEVASGLPPELAQGLFARSGRYEAIIRLSTVPGDLLDDSVSTPRGFALKILNVEGERTVSEEDASQDLICVNLPTFNAKDGKAFLKKIKLLAATTDRAEPVKKALSAVLQQIEKVVEAFGGESAALKSMGGEPPNNILGETFFSQLPVRYSDYIAKFQIIPVSPELTALTDQRVDTSADPNAIRSAVVEHFSRHGGVWELRVQFCRDLEAMPINDGTKEWDESISPFLQVARITAGPQLAWSEERSRQIDDGMGFSPWHGLAAHEPVGELMRIRRTAYLESQRFRSERNAQPVREPHGASEVTG